MSVSRGAQQSITRGRPDRGRSCNNLQPAKQPTQHRLDGENGRQADTGEDSVQPRHQKAVTRRRVVAQGEECGGNRQDGEAERQTTADNRDEAAKDREKPEKSCLADDGQWIRPSRRIA